MVIEARISADFVIDGVAIWLSQKRVDGTGRFVMRMTDAGDLLNLEEVQPGTEIAPTFRLNDDAARALLDALTRHYQGATDLHTVRADLLHERGRVDALIKVISGFVDRALREASP